MDLSRWAGKSIRSINSLLGRFVRPRWCLPHHKWTTSIAAMLSICSCLPRLLWTLSCLSMKSWENLDSSVNRTCLQCCMIHVFAPSSIPNGPGDVDASRGYVCKVFMTANYLTLPPTYRVRENKDPHSIRKVTSKTGFHAWTTKNLSWADVVTLCRPTVFLLAGAPCSRYIS
jgi:hypothetical protein